MATEGGQAKASANQHPVSLWACNLGGTLLAEELKGDAAA
jgi:hypothetical protein